MTLTFDLGIRNFHKRYPVVLSICVQILNRIWAFFRHEVKGRHWEKTLKCPPLKLNLWPFYSWLIVLSGGAGEPCPGGSLEDCIDACPGFHKKAFGICVAECGSRCPWLTSVKKDWPWQSKVTNWLPRFMDWCTSWPSGLVDYDLMTMIIWSN